MATLTVSIPMTQKPSQLYTSEIPKLKDKLKTAIQNGLDKRDSKEKVVVFFRADDIGVVSLQFEGMIDLFIKHNMPLGLAIVPSWFTLARKEALAKTIDISSSQWCWHQHGWLHKNYEYAGKKQEFGPSRSADAIYMDLQRGKERLEETLGSSFFPLFTPPWNRCSEAALSSMIKLQYHGISRSFGALPPAPKDLPEVNINVDLHTRKEDTPSSALKNLLSEITDSVSSGSCGIMLHHQRMNKNSFQLLDTLLKTVADAKELEPIGFTDLFKY